MPFRVPEGRPGTRVGLGAGTAPGTDAETAPDAETGKAPTRDDSGGTPGSTWIVTPSGPATPRATTSTTRRTVPTGPTTGEAGFRVTERIVRSGAVAAAGASTGEGRATAPAARDARRTLIVMGQDARKHPVRTG